MIAAARRSPVLWVAGAIALLGLGAARIGYAPFELRLAMLVLLSGWFVTLVGTVTVMRAPWSRIGWLVLGAAAAWFAAHYRWVAFAPDELARDTALLWAAVLAHAFLAWPRGRAAGRLTAGWIGVIYVVALVPTDATETILAGMLAVGLVASTSQAMRGGRAWPTAPAERMLVVGTGLLVSLVLATYRWLPIEVVPGARMDPRIVLQVAFMVAASVLGGTVIQRAGVRARVTDLVVDLGQTMRGGLVGQLARAIGDPTLQVGLWLPGEGRYVDSAGRPVAPPSDGRSVTAITDGPRPIAILVHHQAVTTDATLRTAVAGAAELWSTNAALQAELRAQVQELEASRNRLVVAGDEARRRIEQRMSDALIPQLARLEALLIRSPAGDPSVADIAEQVAEARRELIELAEGVHPRLLDQHGLAGAIAILAARCRVPVTSDVRLETDPSQAVQATVMFVVSEALANVVKHAAATSVRLGLRSDRVDVHLEVADDGRGGAELARGHGLRGLQDRVASLGGHLQVLSDAGVGTRLVAVLPLAIGQPASVGAGPLHG